MIETAQILLVEDDPMNRDMMSRRLRAQGFKVLTAETGQEAIRAARQSMPAVILLDMRLPDMSGTEVAQALKADAQTWTIPIIALTGAGGKNGLRFALQAGCDECEVKPVELSRLVDKIHRLAFS